MYVRSTLNNSAWELQWYWTINCGCDNYLPFELLHIILSWFDSGTLKWLVPPSFCTSAFFLEIIWHTSGVNLNICIHVQWKIYIVDLIQKWFKNSDLNIKKTPQVWGKSTFAIYRIIKHLKFLSTFHIIIHKPILSWYPP